MGSTSLAGDEGFAIGQTQDLAGAPFLNIFDPGFDFESREVSDAREASWYAQTPLGPLVLRHDEGWQVLRDRRFLFNGGLYLQKIGITEGPLYEWLTGTLVGGLGYDAHARLRKLVTGAFTRRFVENMRSFVQSTAEQLIDTIAANGNACDFMEEFARPMVGRVMCHIFDVPVEDFDRFTRWVSDLGLVFDTAGERLRSEAAVVGMSEYLGDLIDQRRRNLGDDLLSAMIVAEETEDRLSAKELHDMVLVLVWAAQDTTLRQFGRMLFAFSKHPEQWNLLTARPGLVTQAVEEVFRWSPATRYTYRIATEDIAMQGLEIPRGSMVLISIVAGNRDPRAYDNPEVFDITAPTNKTHLTFGGGVHLCLGMHLARLELAEGLALAAQRLGPPTVTGQIQWPAPTAMLHSPDYLPVHFAARSQ